MIMLPDNSGTPVPEIANGNGFSGSHKKTILIFSQDLNFGFSISMLLQDWYNVVTTTDQTLLTTLAGEHGVDLVLLDAPPSSPIMRTIEEIKGHHNSVPLILFYVFEQRSAEIERKVRSRADSVFYKPLDMSAVTERIHQLLLN